MADPGGVSAWTTSAIPVMTSGMANTVSGSTGHRSRLAAKAANASPSWPLCG